MNGIKTMTTISIEDKRRIDTIIWRLNVEVVKQMKKIPANQLFGWKKPKDDQKD